MKLKPIVASLLMLGLMGTAGANGTLSTLPSQQAVVNQNSVVSPVCSEGWFNRISVGGIGSVVAIVGNRDMAGTYTHLDSSSDIYVNNFNLLVNANLSCWSKATANLAYLGAPIMWGNLEAGAPPKSRMVINHSVVVDEGYVTLGNLAKYPFYVMVGKKYLPFGDYADPYIPLQLMSPAQMLAQTNTATVIAGVTTDFGFYASLFGYKGVTNPVNYSAINIRNFGGKIGYYHSLEPVNVPNGYVNFALSYLSNVWDTEVFSPNANNKMFFTNIVSKFGLPVVGNSEMDPVGAVSVHGDFAYKAFSMYADFVSAVKNMAPSTFTTRSSRFWGANVNADLAFKTLDRDSHIGLGVQWSGNGAWFSDNIAAITSDFARIIPRWRVLGEYKVNLYKNTDLDLVVAHGSSYDFTKPVDAPLGGRNSTLGLARLMFQF